jgi:hypothetical protein
VDRNPLQDQQRGVNLASDELSMLELRIARRADELVSHNRFATPLNLHCWFMAESEIIGRAGTSKERQAR